MFVYFLHYFIPFFNIVKQDPERVAGYEQPGKAFTQVEVTLVFQSPIQLSNLSSTILSNN